MENKTVETKEQTLNLVNEEKDFIKDSSGIPTAYIGMTKEEAQKLADDETAMKKENERRETLRHKVVADFVIMCSEFLYQEFLKKLKEQEQKDSFFESMKE